MTPLLAALLLSAAPDAGSLGAWTLPAARPCTTDQVRDLIMETDTPYRLTCRAVLTPGQSVRRPLLIEGAEASGAGLDCNGGAVGRPGAASTTRQPTIAIWSRRVAAAHWSRPTDIRIANCTIHGAVRVWGMGADGGYDDLRASSRTADHTAATQGAAPTHIELDRVTIVGTGSIPLYVGPGVTRLSLTNSTLTGRSVSTAVYLDAESAENRIENNAIAVATQREAVAVDGSARNRIVGNRFALGRARRRLPLSQLRRARRHPAPDAVGQSDHGQCLLGRRATAAPTGRRRFARGPPRLLRRGSRLSLGSSADDGDGATGNVVARNVQR